MDSCGRRGSRSIAGDDALEIVNQVFALGAWGVEEPARIADTTARQCRQGRIDFDRGARGGADGLRSSAGSGRVLNPQGMILAEDRLIAESGRLRVYGDGAWHNARLLRRDPALDLVVLLADGLRGRPAVFALDKEPPTETLLDSGLPLRGVLTGEVTVAEGEVGAPLGVASTVALSAKAESDAGATADSIDADAPLPLALVLNPA